jgi:hypothetical protein
MEDCPMWDGDGCPCNTFSLDRDDLPASGVFAVEAPAVIRCVEANGRLIMPKCADCSPNPDCGGHR